MAIIPVNIENLKPNKEYIVTVRSKNNDVNVVSAYTDSIRFITPTDSTIPDAPTGLELAASFFNVLFKYIDSTGNDIAKYEYELYKQDQIETVDAQYQVISGETPHRTGYVQTNVFLVSVDDNSTTTSTSSTTNPVKYYGRVRAIDTAENIGGWTSIVASGDTPLIDEEFIGSLTAAKITAGEIGAHTIILSGGTGPGNYSMIQSSTYSPNDATPSGWYIRGDGHLNFGGSQGITYNGSSVVIGSGVNVQAELNANSITVGNGPYLRIDDDLQSGTKAGMELGDPTYNYWYTDGQFSLGNSSNYVRWNGTNLSVAGSINILSGTIDPGTTVGGTPVSTIKQSAIDFNLRNNRNSTTPTAPTINSDGTAIDFTINTDGSVDISFEWNYTSSSVQNAANNIDGFYVYVYSSDSSGSYTFGTTPALESTYPLDSDRRAIVLSGVAANKYYTFGIKAFRVVDRDVNSEEILYSSIVKSTGSGENPYRPTANVAFAGNVTGTIDGTATVNSVAVTTITTTVSNFNNNNDQKSTTPATPTSVAFSTATSNTNASIDLPLNWTFTGSGDAYDIDGFIVFLRTTTATDASNITTSDLNTNIQQIYLTAEKRSHTFSGISPSSFYRAAVRAYRVVDTNINSAGIIYGPLVNTTERSSAIAIIGGSSGISIGNGKIYIGTGTFNNANTGFYVDSAGQFSLKDKLVWDGTTLTINGGGTFSGALSAATGTFQGALSGGTISIGSGNNIFKADSNGIYLGDATFALAEFSVTPAGVLKSTSGTIGGWNIGIVDQNGSGALSGALYNGSGSSLSAIAPGGWAWFSQRIVTPLISGYGSGTSSSGGGLQGMFIRNIQYGGTKPGSPGNANVPNVGDVYFS